MEGLKSISPAPKPSDPGLDIIVIHGATTSSLRRLSDGWYKTLLDISPQNTQLLEYDACLELEHKLQWVDIQDRSTALFKALCMENIFDGSKRPVVFVCYGAAGVILKQCILRLGSQNNLKRYLKEVAGIVFFATPHITTSDSATSMKLTAILRHQSYQNKDLFSKSDLTTIAWDALKFAELKLQCPILSCYETVPVTVQKTSVWRLRRVKAEMVDKSCAEIIADGERLVPIDTKLPQFFSSTNRLIHRYVEEFLCNALDIAKSMEKCPSSSKTASLLNPTDIETKKDPDLALVGNFQTSLPRHSQQIQLPTISSPRSASPRAMTPPTSIPDSSSGSPVTLLKSSVASEAVSDNYTLLSHIVDSHVIQDTVIYLPSARRTANEAFRGRKPMLEEMKRYLLPKASDIELSRPKAFVLYGPAGIGKTQLALEFFHKNKSHYNAVFWVSAGSYEAMSASFSEISVYLGLETRYSAKDVVVSRELVKGWLADPFQNFKTHQGKLMTWLLIFDNADEPDLLNDFWPYDGQGSVIITSRDPVTAKKCYYDVVGKVIESLAEEDAVDLMTKILHQNGLQIEPYEVRLEVVRVLDCYPLAIVQMAGVMIRKSYSQTAFLQAYRDESQRQKLYCQKGGTQHGYSVTLSTNWALSGMSLGASSILSVISLLVPTSIDENILTTAPELTSLAYYPRGSEFNERMSELTSSFIVYREERRNVSESTALVIHPIIQDVVRSQLCQSPDDLVAAFNSAVGLLTGVWPYVTRPVVGYAGHDRVGRWKKCDVVLPHVKRLRKIFETFNDSARHKCAKFDFLELLSEVAWYYFERLSPDECVDYVQGTLEIHDMCPDDYPKIVANQYGTWGSTAITTNQLDLALSKMQRHLEIREEVFLQTRVVDSHIAAAYSEMARAMIANGLFGLAESYAQRSIELRKQMPQFTRLQLHSPLICLAWIDWHERRYESAEKRLLEALSDREVKFGKDDRENSRAGELQYYLGRIYSDQGRLRESEQYHKRALLQFRDTLGNKDFYTALACYQLARLSINSRDYGLASDLLNEASEVFSLRKYNIPYLARTIFLQSHLLRGLGQTEVAEKKLEESTKLRRKYVDFDLRSGKELAEADFDDSIVFFFR